MFPRLLNNLFRICSHNFKYSKSNLHFYRVTFSSEKLSPTHIPSNKNDSCQSFGIISYVPELHINPFPSQLRRVPLQSRNVNLTLEQTLQFTIQIYIEHFKFTSSHLLFQLFPILVDTMLLNFPRLIHIRRVSTMYEVTILMHLNYYVMDNEKLGSKFYFQKKSH